MPKDHARKNANKRAQQRTGARRASAAAGTTHQHPAPDLSGLPSLPHAFGQPVDVELATAVVGACRAGCRPCQDSLIPRLRGDRATVAALAGGVYGPLPAGASGGWVASETTRRWVPMAIRAQQSGDGAVAFAGVNLLDEQSLADLVEDVLDMWAAGGAAPGDVQFHTITPEDLGLDPRTAADLLPYYGGMLTRVTTPDGRPLPGLVLVPESEGAGLADLRARTSWQPWDGQQLSQMDPNWRMRVDIGSRSLSELVHVDPEGYDDAEVWRAAEPVTLPEHWWDLLDRAQHILVAGPLEGEATEAELKRAGAAGELVAIVARVSFL